MEGHKVQKEERDWRGLSCWVGARAGLMETVTLEQT